MRKALLIGEYEKARYHPLTGVDTEITSILDGDFKVDIMEDYGKLSYEMLKDFDLLISFVDVGCFEEKTSKAFVAGVITFLCNGGGLLAIHNGIFLQHNYELAMVLGGKLTKHPPYTTLSLEVCDKNHPITQNIENFDIGDEPYTFEMDCFTVKTIFLEYKYGNNSFPAAWCHNYGNGRVVYISIGHEASTFRNIYYRRILKRSAQWAVGQIY